MIKSRLDGLCVASESARQHLALSVVLFNGKPGDPRSFDLLEELLEQQCYRLAYWRVAPDEINYRRFFDVNDLAALNMEREDVFEAAHALILRWLPTARSSGLRIDHPDGLYDPRSISTASRSSYRLACARRIFETKARRRTSTGTTSNAGCATSCREWLAAWKNAGGPALYVVVEKILGPGESLVESWPVARHDRLRVSRTR